MYLINLLLYNINLVLQEVCILKYLLKKKMFVNIEKHVKESILCYGAIFYVCKSI